MTARYKHSYISTATTGA